MNRQENEFEEYEKAYNEIKELRTKVAELEAKVYTYEQIIAKSNFKTMIASNRGQNNDGNIRGYRQNDPNRPLNRRSNTNRQNKTRTNTQRPYIANSTYNEDSEI